MGTRLQSYWILDGSSKAYDLKEEIKNQGGKYNPDFKCWWIDRVNVHHPIYKLLKLIGLKLQAK